MRYPCRTPPKADASDPVLCWELKEEKALFREGKGGDPPFMEGKIPIFKGKAPFREAKPPLGGLFILLHLH